MNRELAYHLTPQRQELWFDGYENGKKEAEARLLKELQAIRRYALAAQDSDYTNISAQLSAILIAVDRALAEGGIRK